MVIYRAKKEEYMIFVYTLVGGVQAYTMEISTFVEKPLQCTSVYSTSEKRDITRGFNTTSLENFFRYYY